MFFSIQAFKVMRGCYVKGVGMITLTVEHERYWIIGANANNDIRGEKNQILRYWLILTHFLEGSLKYGYHILPIIYATEGHFTVNNELYCAKRHQCNQTAIT